MSIALQPGAPRVLVTGAAGFIGAHTCVALRARGCSVLGADNFNDFYDPVLKRARVAQFLAPGGIACERIDVADAEALWSLFERQRPQIVVHLAAQAGVRHSIDHAPAYTSANLLGFANILEASRAFGVEHLVFASSSSVYGARTDAPFRETDSTDAPMSFYAATKKANEVMAHAYGHIHRLRCTGLRFFTVYGPWGRPDMAYFSFAQRMAAGQPLPVFARGELLRDFTYVDDIVEGVVRLALSAPLACGPVACEIFNIGNHRPVRVLDFVDQLAACMGKTPQLEFLPMQPGDVPATCADVTRLRERVGFEPSTPLREGLARFVEWFGRWPALRSSVASDPPDPPSCG